MGGFYGSWIPNVNSELIPSLNLLAVGEALGKRFFDPFYDVLSFEATSNALNTLPQVICWTSEYHCLI